MSYNLETIKAAGLEPEFYKWRGHQLFTAWFNAIRVAAQPIFLSVSRLEGLEWILGWSLIIGAINFPFAMALMFAWAKVNHLIPNQAQAIVDSGDGLNHAGWGLKSHQQLTAAGFKVVGTAEYPEFFDESIAVYEGDIAEVDSIRDYIIRVGNKTVAVSSVLAVADALVWKPESDSQLLDGIRVVGRQEAIAGSQIENCLVDGVRKQVELVCVGLDSFPPSKTERVIPLSARRARALYATVTSPEFVWSNNKFVEVTAIDLGKAIKPSDSGTEEERRQRAAIIIVLSRLETYERVVPFRFALGEIIRCSEIRGTVLSEFEHSDQPEDRLLSQIWEGFEPIKGEWD